MSAHFVIVTDSHLFPDAPKDFSPPKLITRSPEILDAAVPQIAAVDAEFVVHGGDIVCGGGDFGMTSEGYEGAVQIAVDRFSALTVPFYAIPGNHDTDPATGKFDTFNAHFPVPDPITLVDAGPRLRLALVNVYPGDPLDDINGEWTDAHDRALRAAAESAHDDRSALLIIMHTWLLEERRNEDGTPRGVILGADRLRATIAECPAVIAVFCGHRHRNRISAVQDYLVVDTGALVGFPMGFREIWLSDDGVFRTRFHTLDAPEIVQSSYDTDTEERNRISEGEEWDRNAEIVIPRLRDIWSDLRT